MFVQLDTILCLSINTYVCLDYECMDDVDRDELATLVVTLQMMGLVIYNRVRFCSIGLCIAIVSSIIQLYNMY